MSRETTGIRSLGLYVHIPFCAKLCHYCDFAKTANFNDDHVDRYLQILRQQFQCWIQYWRNSVSARQPLTSVYFGGGTPGLLTHAYEPFMRDIMAVTDSQAEVTIEANPLNVSEESLQIWRDQGFNRLSLGVQTFDPVGLKVLTRDHSEHQARKSLELAASRFPKSNGDLIYGWNGQTERSWHSDLDAMAASGVNHISAYALTYEGHTPLARSKQRGILQPMDGDDVAHRYELAREMLGAQGFLHEEISNWSKPGGEGRHNWLYWRGQHYLGIGAGAHGYVDDGSTIGLRYHYPGDLRAFIRQGAPQVTDPCSSVDVVQMTGGILEQGRTLEAWLYEYVGCGIRSLEGIDLRWLRHVGFEFRASGVVQRGLDEGLLRIEGHQLKAVPSEWFRETAWSYHICKGLAPVTPPTS